jgi:hypothetical protein
MHGTVLLAAVIVAIAGCVGRIDGPQSLSPDASNTDARLNPDGSFYACRADGQSDGPASAPLRLISVRQQPESHRMLLMPLALSGADATNGAWGAAPRRSGS